MTDQGALLLMLVAVCFFLQVLTGKALGLFWLAWREEVRWSRGLAAYTAMMKDNFARGIKEAGK